MRGSIRTFNKETRSVVLSRIHKITTAISTGYSCTSEVVITPLTPSVVNSTEVASKVIETAGKYLPDNNIDISYQVMASDDIAFFLEKIPGCYILIGSADEGKQLVSHHHNPNFDFVEEAMISAITLLLGISTTYLNPMS
jgi:metal-dependent amidase/aminoacylase/carboxypeptidase family protein